MFRSAVDTPWAVDARGDYSPELPNDPNHAATIKSWRDITGEAGQWVEEVGKTLYGGNYAKATGIQPDYSIGRLGGSGDPDWLTIEVITETLTAVDDINADPSDKYLVLWTEEIIEPEAPATVQSANNKDDIPDAAEFGLMRAKLARRGVPQPWIDKFLGTAVGGRSRKTIELDLSEGYVSGQIAPGAGTVDMSPLVAYLTDEGWRCFNVRETLIVLIEIDGELNSLIITEDELLDCANHATMTPRALWSDIHEFTVQAGYCN